MNDFFYKYPQIIGLRCYKILEEFNKQKFYIVII
jgi:hypothetical protein